MEVVIMNLNIKKAVRAVASSYSGMTELKDGKLRKKQHFMNLCNLILWENRVIKKIVLIVLSDIIK